MSEEKLHIKRGRIYIGDTEIPRVLKISIEHEGMTNLSVVDLKFEVEIDDLQSAETFVDYSK